LTYAGIIPSIPDHSVLRIIGRGSYGEIWLARALTGAFRAVKVVYRSTFESERSFAREFEGMSSFEPVSRDHDGFVDILHVGRSDNFFYYIMELADDNATGRPLAAGASAAEIDAYKPKTLKAECDWRKRLPVEECLRLGSSLAEALDDLHSHRLTHRDIKPANIIFVDGRPKLADIGLVASVGQRSFVGTEGYVPPEGPGSPASDVYSLGKVLYEIAMGKDRLDFPELSTGLENLPDKSRLLALNQVLLRACATNPTARYRSARELATDLAALETGRSPRRRRRVPWAVIIWCAPLICIGVAAYWLTHLAPRAPAPSDVRIETDPPGAMVILGDGMERSPALFENVEAGTYDLHIMLSGYDPIETRIDTASPPGPFQLKRSAGALTLDVQPPGAASYELIDAGKTIRSGPLPANLADLPTGSYEVLAHRGGRTIRQSVDIEREPGQPVTLIFATGHVEVESDPPGAEIFTGGVSEGKAPVAIDLPIGPCDIAARYRNWPESVQTVAVQAGANPPVEFAFHNGSVKITSAPGGAAVLQNGVELGRTPLLIDEVEPGPVTYSLRLDGYKPALVSGTVASRDQTFLAARLEVSRSPEPGKPWENSLGMKFVPLGPIYISIWDTRVSDYDAFCAATGRIYKKPDFQQGPAEPAVLVSWNDAEAFCKWLTQKEVQEGVLEEGQSYRLPTDAEWSAADGLPPEGGATPEERDGKMHGVYPWGAAWPPPADSGNFADQSAGRGSGKIIDGYKDGWAATSPVGFFPPNRLGLYDMSGNVWQWVEDGYREDADNARDWGVLRGGSWGTSSREELQSSYRYVVDRNDRDVIYGFRCVLAP
jgi:formylglycine-generating enzyme required for sulfatase activity/serine/threonine protein kinase